MMFRKAYKKASISLRESKMNKAEKSMNNSSQQQYQIAQKTF